MPKNLSNMQVAAIQMVSGTSLENNLQQAADLVSRAAQAGALLVALPEYFCFMGQTDSAKLALAEEPGMGPIQGFLAEQASKNGIWLIGGTLPLKSPDPERIYNACLVYDPAGNMVARYDKIHLFSFQRGKEAYDESIAIRPGDKPPQVFESPFGRTALGICYDLRFPEFFRAQGDVNLMVLPAAFTWTTGSVHWELLLRARAVENQCYVLGSAQGGKHQNGRRTWGHSMLVDPWGEVLDCLPDGPGLAMGVIDSQRITRVRESLPALRHRVM